MKWSRKSLPVVNENYSRLTDLLNIESYSKGALFLDAIRSFVGDELFFRGIKEYYKEFRHSNVTTGDFKSVMSKVSGRELDSLFRQWLYRPGLPD